jgi:hypothetical protein
MSPTLVACVTARHVPQTSGLLDAGCGTIDGGGARLSAGDRHRYERSDVGDRPAAFRLRKLPKDGFSGERLDFQDATFGAVVAAGVFTATRRRTPSRS